MSLPSSLSNWAPAPEGAGIPEIALRTRRRVIDMCMGRGPGVRGAGPGPGGRPGAPLFPGHAAPS